MKHRLNQIEVSRDYELIEEAHIFEQPILNLILATLLQSSFLGSEQNKPRLNNDDVVTLASSCLPESYARTLPAGGFESVSRRLYLRGPLGLSLLTVRCCGPAEAHSGADRRALSNGRASL